MSNWTIELLIVLLPLIVLGALLALALVCMIAGAIRRRRLPPHRIRVMTEGEIALRMRPEGGVERDPATSHFPCTPFSVAGPRKGASWDS
jgi:hypothetical protein